MPAIKGFICVCVFLAGMPAAAALSLQFEQNTEVEGRTIRSLVKVRDEAFRVDMLSEGMRASVVRNPDGLFNILHDQGMAMKIPDSQENDDFALMRHVQDFDAYLAAQAAEKIGEAELDGELCDIYSIASNNSKVWVSQSLRFPLRVETAGQVVAFSNIQQDAALDASDFELPEGIQVLDLQGVDLTQAFGAQEPEASIEP